MYLPPYLRGMMASFIPHPPIYTPSASTSRRALWKSKNTMTVCLLLRSKAKGGEFKEGSPLATGRAGSSYMECEWESAARLCRLVFMAKAIVHSSMRVCAVRGIIIMLPRASRERQFAVAKGATPSVVQAMRSLAGAFFSPSRGRQGKPTGCLYGLRRRCGDGGLSNARGVY